MKYLSKLTPAETILILKGGAPVRGLLKATFMDLLLKEVLEIVEVAQQPDKNGKVLVYKYVARGKNFANHKPLQHERVYLSPYYQSGSIKILLTHLLKMGAENAARDGKYSYKVAESPAMNGYFTQNFFERIFGGFSISTSGLEVRRQVKAEIEKLEKELPPVFSVKAESLEITRLIGGNIILLEAIMFSSIQQLDNEIHKEIGRYSPQPGSSGGSGCAGGGCSSGHGGHDSGGHGCSSGCSGCGGGGCGGCGS